MSATRILWGQIIAVFALTLAGIWAATQWAAAALGFQRELGSAWFTLSGHPVYPPYAIFWWWFSYEAYAPRIFETAGLIAASGGLASVAVAIAMSVWRAREVRNSATYGSARWATRREIAKAGLLDGRGVVIGRHANLYLRHDGPEHVLCRPGSSPTLLPQRRRWGGRRRSMPRSARRPRRRRANSSDASSPPEPPSRLAGGTD